MKLVAGTDQNAEGYLCQSGSGADSWQLSQRSTRGIRLVDGDMLEPGELPAVAEYSGRARLAAGVSELVQTRQTGTASCSRLV